MDGVVDLIEDHQLVLSGQHLVATEIPAAPDGGHIFRIGFLRPNLHKAAAHGNDLKTVFRDHPGAIQLAIMPGSLDELYHEHLEPLSYGPERHAHRRAGLALAVPGVDHQQAHELPILQEPRMNTDKHGSESRLVVYW